MVLSSLKCTRMPSVISSTSIEQAHDRGERRSSCPHGTRDPRGRKCGEHWVVRWPRLSSVQGTGLGSETGRSASVEFNSLVNVAVVTLLSGPVPVLYELRRRQLAGFERRVDI
jgi:hypothetical protein